MGQLLVLRPVLTALLITEITVFNTELYVRGKIRNNLNV